MGSLANIGGCRVLVIASERDKDAAVAFQTYATGNADRITWENFRSIGSAPVADISKARYAGVHFFISQLDLTDVVSISTFTALAQRVRPGGFVNLHLAVAPDAKADSLIADVKKTMIYAGLLKPEILRDKQNAQGRRAVHVASQKPHLPPGAATPLNLIDEDNLLENEPEYQPFSTTTAEDCSTKPRACANCSCGRKELEEKLGAEEAKQRLENSVVRSSCGNCYLGDAFRCSGCPYKGLPAFKPGTEKVQLDLLSDTVVSTPNESSGAVATANQRGAVMISGNDEDVFAQ